MNQGSKRFFWNETAILISLALFKLALILTFSGRYGYFRDELYYIACSDHLAFGYVDQPPLSIFILALNRVLFGDSLFALRLLPAIAGGLTVFLAGLMARKFGAGRFGQALAALTVLASPVFLGQSRYFSMNGFDLLFWAIASYLLILIIKENKPRLWLAFGLVIGLGLLNKYSIGFFIIGMVAGFLLTAQRKQLLSRWLWAGGFVAAALFLPHIIWEVKHGFPSLEFMRNASFYKNIPISPFGFLMGQFIEVGPANAVVWLLGLAYFFFHRAGRQYRFLGWIYVVVFGVMVATRAKVYYLSPIYTVLLAGGAVWIEELGRRSRWRWLKPAAAGLAVALGVLIAPFAVPVLPVESFIRYQKFLGVTSPQEERNEIGALPQHYADMFGWEEMVQTVAGVYKSLPADKQAHCLIYVRNYGQAGAIDFFGPKYGLPKAACGHNNYWLWGLPRDWKGEVAIIFGDSQDVRESVEDLSPNYDRVELAATFTCQYCMPYENNRPIFICRGLKLNIPLDVIWAEEKHFE